jgi:hypothetical protein
MNLVFVKSKTANQLIYIYVGLAAPNGGALVNYTPATDWQMLARPDNVISITLR